MAKQPEARYRSVSQNDNFNECQCDCCRAQNARYGGSSGTMVAFVMQFTAELGMQKARFIRVSALSRLKCPDWHIAAGQKCRIFAGEIVAH